VLTFVNIDAQKNAQADLEKSVKSGSATVGTVRESIDAAILKDQDGKAGHDTEAKK